MDLPENKDPESSGTEDSLGFAVIDTYRDKRTGYPEVVFCSGKTTDQAEAIIVKMREQGIPVLGTKADQALADRVLSRFPETEYDAISRILMVGRVRPKTDLQGLIAVVAAGTSDLPIAKEAALSAEFLGSKVELINDVGIAGIHRLFRRLPDIRKARVVVAVAGMEGALAGVLAGQISVPVIAVPTSVGYGASFGGLSALLGMITSCAPGISVVNIDNGFGAGYQANLINQGAAAIL
ncbi:phosphoribosylaminoimidazole carboxylase ncair mutase subunit [Treponema primitia ZAS-2]|uniref:Phosphoribosylaminoimidazole carboxylase ncair mutase subunit n=1 Tax=Treponema primitia (strain ATCC BAA-887 / DSM 12427 / ZAS-2) TaxID=545694 RepID=F5YKZ6_TREPZ|nr:nickel pincer cofactor biosynthesis protein LarB [Treponema primitia]AEF85337.1 phosphoribosylaminoimidazole carboxylase ncair mutase subunit [Treponema primitia ZAS-2]